jgi:integrase
MRSEFGRAGKFRAATLRGDPEMTWTHSRYDWQTRNTGPEKKVLVTQPYETAAEKARKNRKKVLDKEEFDRMLSAAAQIKDEFFRLRSTALLCIFRLVGKRRGEIAMLKTENVKVENNQLTLTFTLEKKVKHFKVCPKCDARNTVDALYCAHCAAPIDNEPLQSKGKQYDSTKAIPLTDSLTEPIIKYLDYLKHQAPVPTFFFPRVKATFGQGYIILPDEHLHGRQVFNLVRQTSDRVWPHLFRETVAADVVKQDSSLYSAFRVKDRLDLEDYRTGFAYVKRFALDVINRPTET